MHINYVGYVPSVSNRLQELVKEINTTILPNKKKSRIKLDREDRAWGRKLGINQMQTI